jgi:lipoprotein-anchoring transpeptidase ErfK/SrfK
VRAHRSLRSRFRAGSIALAVGAATLVLAACQTNSQATGQTGVDVGTSQSPSGPAPVLVLGSLVPYDAAVSIGVRNGKLESVTVTQTGGSAMAGTVSSNGSAWVSASLPHPGARYTVAASATGDNGKAIALGGSFAVTAVPNGRRLTLTVSPGTGSVVGVGAPIIIRFDQTVTNRAAVERALVVTSSVPVVGAWHWFGSNEVHFRPQTYWPAHTTVDVKLNLNGVVAGPGLWGGRNYDSKFTIGDSHVALVDARAETFTVRVNGKVTGVWPTSLGRPQFATRSGTYIVLDTTPKIEMTSCSARIQCVKGAPNYYDLWVSWDVRLTNSGTFVHAAPWSVGNQGRANVSHGCVNLSTAHGEAFYHLSRYGDIVTVVHSSRTPADLLASGDPGMVDWNWTWSTWVGGSALKAPVQTGPIV